MYPNYKIARDSAWKVLIECEIKNLPINLADITTHYNIHIIKFSNSNQYLTGDGFTTLFNNQTIIYYNDSDYPVTRQRFTIAHELGHILLGHLQNVDKTFYRNTETDVADPLEQQANIFARDILMPATVLHRLNVKSAEEISNICNVSMQSAGIRYKRILEINERGMYNKHPLEQQVYNQFMEYIGKYVKQSNSFSLATDKE